MRTISSVSTGRTRRFTTLACTTRLLPKLRNILILLYQVDYIIAGSISAFQHAPASPPLVSTALRAFQHAALGFARRLVSISAFSAVGLVPAHVLRDVFPAEASPGAAEKRTLLTRLRS